MADSIDPGLAIQDAIEAALRVDTGLQALFIDGKIRLFTHTAPNNTPHPYIVTGDDQVLGDDTECASSSETVVKVHVFARGAALADSGKQARTIGAAIRKCLTRRLTLAGHKMDVWEFDSLLPLVEPDGLTSHCVVQFTYQTTAFVTP